MTRRVQQAGDDLLKSLKIVFDNSPQPVGVAKVILDDEGNPCDFEYFYLNSKLADLSGEKVEDLQGGYAYERWGNDDLSWLAHFSDAAFDGIACEFETAAILLERFLHVTVSPLIEGYCTFMIQDIATFVDQDQYIEDDLSVGLFFLDLRTTNVMLSTTAQERYGFEKKYISSVSFATALFGDAGARAIEDQIEKLRYGSRDVLYEGCSVDGRWLRITASHIPQSESFVFCTVKDITRARKAEERSAYRMSVIESLTRENFALYVIDLNDNSIEEYSRSGDQAGVGFVYSIVDESYNDIRQDYLENVVAPDDCELVDTTLSKDTLQKFFETDQSDIAITYKRMIDGKENYVEARLIRLIGKEKTAVLAIRNIHSEMEAQLRQKIALQEALDLAQHASAAKSTFLTNMSHDFRTPMNSIVGFTNIALENTGDVDRMVDCLNKIRTSSDHLLRLINDVLDVSRIESGIVESEEDELDLIDFAKSIEAVFSGDAMSRSIDFTIDTSELERTKVYADRQHLGQILVNLVGNAFKFTDAGGKVDVKIAEFHNSQSDYGAHVPAGYGRFEFIVSDTGCGMIPEFLDILFVPFERNGLGRANTVEGTGLGMPITKNLVDLLGGLIEVKSEVGVGTEFTVTIPLRLADQSRPSSASNSGVTEFVEVAKEKDPKEQFEGKHLLIVDDDELSREILKEILLGVGFVVDEAEDGIVAVDMALTSEPGTYDGIIMDMRMPIMSGDEAAREIRDSSRADLKEIPIIALTADAFEEGRRRSREAGMVAHITKPFKRAELMRLLSQYL